MYFFSPVDELFALLPILVQEQHRGFQPREQIVGSGNTSDLHCICDVRKIGDNEFFKLSNVKTVAWIDCKVRISITLFILLDYNFDLFVETIVVLKGT